jgi:hypothetical protein
MTPILVAVSAKPYWLNISHMSHTPTSCMVYAPHASISWEARSKCHPQSDLLSFEGVNSLPRNSKLYSIWSCLGETKIFLR